MKGAISKLRQQFFNAIEEDKKNMSKCRIAIEKAIEEDTYNQSYFMYGIEPNPIYTGVIYSSDRQTTVSYPSKLPEIRIPHSPLSSPITTDSSLSPPLPSIHSPFQ